MVSAPDTRSAADGILGVRPRIIVEPGSVAEAAEAMRGFARDHLAVGFVGGGTALELGAPPSRLDALVRTRKLARIREYSPSDQIVAVEAGMTLAELQRHLAAHGQRLALDPPFADRATVGGIVAASCHGPRRLRFGVPRDLVIGITIVRADGVVAHGGGKVVKNVAGFDLPRLYCGSLGTLGLIAEVVFRLHPLPEASATAVFDGLAADEVVRVVPSLRELGVEPVAATAFEEQGRFTLLVRFEGFAPGVRDQVERTLAKVGSGAEAVGTDEAALWARHDALQADVDVRCRASFAPAGLVKALAALAPLAAALEGGGLVAHPALGLALLSGNLRDPEAAGRGVAAARPQLASLGNGSLVLTAAPAALRARADVWGPDPGGIAVMRRLKHELDPEARLAPGRFVGGI